MNNRLFTDIEFNKIRKIIIDEKTYYVGKDVAEILGYKNTRKAIIDHVASKNKKYNIGLVDSLGRIKYPVFINDSGLCSLIFGSKLPKAKQFRKWVMYEVFPAIFENGFYDRRKELYRGLGSIDVIAAARSVLQVERCEENPDIRVVRQIKNSLEPSDGEFYFEISSENGFRWLDCKDVDDIPMQPVAAPPTFREITEIPVFQNKLDKAAYLIKSYLQQGDMPALDMYSKLSEARIGHKTAEDARKTLGISCYRKMRKWYWSIEPSSDDYRK